MRKFLKKLHLWIGLIFCLPLILMGLTGSILIFERESEKFFTPKYSLQTVGEKHLASEIIEAASNALPKGFKPNMYKASQDNKPASVRFFSQDKKITEILVDPISLQILEEKNHSNNIFKTIEQLHTNLLLKDYGGRSIIGCFGIALLLLSLSGIIIWFPKAKSTSSILSSLSFRLPSLSLRKSSLPFPLSSLSFPRRRESSAAKKLDSRLRGNDKEGKRNDGEGKRNGKEGKRNDSISKNFKSGLFIQKGLRGYTFHKNLHKVVGFWSFIFLLIMSFSAIYLAFPKKINGAISATFSARDFTKNITIENSEEKSLKNIDELIEIAKNEMPNGNLLSIILSPKPTQPYKINFFSSRTYQIGQPYATIFINQFSSEILEARNPEKYQAAEKFISWQKPLHTAQGLGAIWYIPIFFIGLLPAIFAITGCTMWLKKRRK